MRGWNSDFYEKSLKVLKWWLIVNLAATVVVPALYAVSKSYGLEALKTWSEIMMACGGVSWLFFLGYGTTILDNNTIGE